jgi:hypothetical protein
MKALGRFRIVDFGGVLAGAGATRILAAFGADVIRVEDPSNQGRWDVVRGSPPYPTGEAGLELSGGFNNHNVEKRGITLNLKTEGGRQLLRKLIAVSDVVTENFAAGVLARGTDGSVSTGAERRGPVGRPRHDRSRDPALRAGAARLQRQRPPHAPSRHAAQQPQRQPAHGAARHLCRTGRG